MRPWSYEALVLRGPGLMRTWSYEDPAVLQPERFSVALLWKVVIFDHVTLLP